jgi:hypothetical protein
LFGGDDASKALQKYCNYQWSDETSNPTAADIDVLPSVRSANCTYITPQQGTSDAFTQWARDELLPPMAERLPASGTPATNDIKVRVVVLDTAPPGRTDSLPSRHGRTLAQLIRDSACQNAAADPADCAVEVQSALAMPRLMNSNGIPYSEPTGGYFGLLSDLTSAVWEEAKRYRSEMENALGSPEVQRKVPLRVIFNESFGFGNTDAFPNRCSDTAPPANDITASALFDAMTAASCLGILHVAAAGNHTGGNSYLDGMLCPARWDHAITVSDGQCATLWGPSRWSSLRDRFMKFAIEKTGEPKEYALFSADAKAIRAGAASGADSLLSVGGVDYHGSPIVLTRPKACPEAVAIGIGGTSFGASQDVLPFLFGTSVSAAVASARIAIKWSQYTNGTATEMQSFSGTPPTLFQRGTELQRGTGLCGGTPINCGNTPWIGKPATLVDGQNRAWPTVRAQTLWASLAPRTEGAMESLVCLNKLPHCQRPSRAMTSDVWPQPVDPVCIKCGIFLPRDTEAYPELWIEPNLSFHSASTGALLIVEDDHGAVQLTRRVSQTSISSSSRIALTGATQPMFTNARVWLSGYDSEGHSFSQQIFVDQ